jgi:hypothetical protein
MRAILLTALFSCLPAIAGCIAVVPVAEFMPATTDGTLDTSHCMGAKSVRHVFDGVPVWVYLSGSGTDSSPARLTMGLALAEGRVARIPAPEIRIRPLDAVTEQGFLLPAWERSVLRKMKTRRNRLERVIVETGPPSGPLVGGTPDDGGDVMGRPTTKSFVVSIALAALPARGYRVELPAIEIDGRLHAIAPIEYRQQLRVEFMVPLNC